MSKSEIFGKTIAAIADFTMETCRAAFEKFDEVVNLIRKFGREAVAKILLHGEKSTLQDQDGHEKN